ncbi:MAG: peptide chain release factor N(5)-glutamine methyltransferase [Pseudomonadales bacterium]|nr:peptide chain release factor N(5)-glutamine methyltransferase [Pseudomonadales bacterium]
MSSVSAWLRAHADLARIDCERLLCELPAVAGSALTPARIRAAPETTLSDDALVLLASWAARRRAGEPLAYILGRQGFRAFEVEVSPAVLVPRPETEHLVETALEHLTNGDRVLELGCGSGAVAIAIALESAARVTATDVSCAALALARVNARRLGAAIEWLASDWFTAVDGRFDLIVSNPPYIAADDEHLDALTHEPRLALVGGPDGLDAIRRIVAAAPDHLRAGGRLILEHGYDQGARVRALLAARGFVGVATRHDLAGHERITEGQWP